MLTPRKCFNPDSNSVNHKQANNLSSFDEMMEKEMVADIMKANNDLKAFKQFRVLNEKHYQVKYSDQTKRREYANGF
jgi:hypothetical protein